MQLNQELTDHQYQIRAYDEHSITINSEQYSHSLIIMPPHPIQAWPVNTISDITKTSLQTVVALAPQIVLIGTGHELAWPSAETLVPLATAKIGVEVMDSKAACRTFNILLAEGRKVALAIIICGHNAPHA